MQENRLCCFEWPLNNGVYIHAHVEEIWKIETLLEREIKPSKITREAFSDLSPSEISSRFLFVRSEVV